MPFCSHCGTQVGGYDQFCANCGSRQPAPVPPFEPPPYPNPAGEFAPRPVPDPFHAVPPRTLAILCYVPVMGWVASVIALGARRFRSERLLRFHAFQGLYIFAAWLVVDWAIEPIFSFMPRNAFRPDHLLQFFLIGLWIFMLVKTSQGETYSLPVLGELAQRSAQDRQ